MEDIGEDRFEALVVDALDEIPEGLARRMDNVAVVIEEDSRFGDLLGLYQGVPLTERDEGYGGFGNLPVPDRITIFRRPILAMCATEREVVEQVRITVVHEVAHHFGIDDDRLHELGWG